MVKHRRLPSRSSPLALAAAIVLLAPEAGGQTVAGAVRAGPSGTPLPQTTVVLTTSDGRLLRGAVTGDDGTYTLHAPAAGRYRVKARRIGFAPDSVDVMLPATATVAFSPTLRPYATRLTAMRVGTSSACVTSATTAAQTARLWNDVQAALTSTAIAAQPTDGARLTFVLRRFARVVDPASSLVLRSRMWDFQGAGEAYASLPAESLTSAGFIQPGRDSTLYAAPDAGTLASGAFARSHCFYAVSPDSAHPDAIGLGFRPVDRNTPRDVQGVLWVDTASAELRALEYRYTGRFAATSLGLDAPSGIVEYGKVGKGAWIVRHWLVRVPVVGKMALDEEPVSDSSITSRPHRDRFVVRYEAGGEVLRTYVARGDTLLPLPASIAGQVADSTSIPVGGARDVRVSLTSIVPPGAPAPASRTTLTDSTGGFAFDDLAPGDYVVRWTSARFDTLGVAIQGRAAHVESGDHAWVPSAIPPLATIVHGICADVGARPGVVLHGSVTDPATHTPIPDAVVSVTWRDTTVRGGTTGWTHATDSTGQYVACGIPPSDSLHFAVRAGDAHLATTLHTTSRAVQRYDVASSALANSASLLVSLVDGHGRAVVNGEVRVDSGTWVRGSARAPIQLTKLAAGQHVLEARAPGEPVHGWAVRLHPGRAVSTTLTLARSALVSGTTQLQTVQVVAAAPSRFEKHRATGMGHYIDRAQIAARGYPQLIDLLRTVPGVSVVRAGSDGGGFGGDRFELQMRGASLLGSFVMAPGATNHREDDGAAVALTPETASQAAWTGNRCQVEIYVEGSRMYFPQDMATSDMLRSLVRTTDVVGIEVYPSGATIPAEYASMDAACGVIAVWTGGDDSPRPAGTGGK